MLVGSSAKLWARHDVTPEVAEKAILPLVQASLQNRTTTPATGANGVQMWPPITSKPSPSPMKDISYSDHSVGSKKQLFFLHQFHHDLKTFLLPGVVLRCTMLEVLYQTLYLHF